MVLPRASNLNVDSANESLIRLAQGARINQLRQRQLLAEDEGRKAQILSTINPATLSDKFDSDVVNQALTGMIANVAQFNKRNPNSSQLRDYVYNELGKLSQWSSKVKSAREAIDNGMKNFQMQGFDKGLIRARAIDAALFKVDQVGNKVLKSPEEIQTDNDYIAEVISKDPESVFSGTESWEMLRKVKAELDKSNVTEDAMVKDQNGRVRKSTREKVTYPAAYMENDPNGGGVRVRGYDEKDPVSGKVVRYVDNQIYSQFESVPALNTLMTVEAKKAIKLANLPADAHNLEMAKRAWLTDYLSSGAPRSMVTEKGTVVNIGSGGGSGSRGGSSSSNTETPFVDIYGMLKEHMASHPRGSSTPWWPVNSLSSQLQKSITAAAKDATGASGLGIADVMIQQIDGEPWIVAAKRILGDDGLEKFKSGQPMTQVDESFNIGASRAAFGQKGATSAAKKSNTKPKTSGGKAPSKIEGANGL